MSFQKFTRAESYKVLSEEEQRKLLEQKRASYEKTKHRAVRATRNA